MRNELHKRDYKRLNLGVVAAAVSLTAVRILHWDLQTTLGHVETVLQGGLTGRKADCMRSAYTTAHAWKESRGLLVS